MLATRADEGEVWVGLREAVDRERYLEWIERQDAAALLGSLNKVRVRHGDVVYVPAGVPHAIGAGVLLAEVQEPTDFSIVCEWAGFPIDPGDSHVGLGWPAALEAASLLAHEPTLGLPEEARAFFWADEIPEPAGRFAVLIVLEGEGAIDGSRARRGDCFVVPAAAARVDISPSLRVLRCLGPTR